MTLDYRWPLDTLRNLSADETEILAYNESGDAIEFLLPKITFTENGVPRLPLSGTWEKFPSRSSWERSEYISIPPSPYQGESLVLLSGEKAKLHWHMEGVSSTETGQVVSIELEVTTGTGAQTIAETLMRNTDQGRAVVAIAPGPTQEPVESKQSAGGEAHAESSSAASSVL